MSPFFKSLDLPDAPDIIPEEQLPHQLALIEIAAEKGESSNVLEAMVRRVHHGSRIVVASLEEGKILHRAVRYRQKPWWQRQLGRPPNSIVGQMGRVNMAGESVFYSVLGSPAACLIECDAAIGQTFAVSAWKTVKRMNLQSFGYVSEKVMSLRTEPATKAGWMYPATSRIRERLLCEWQSKVFNKEAGDYTYALSNALTKFGLSDVVNGRRIPSSEFHGIIYPSVAAEFLGDNIALTPRFADQNLLFQDCKWIEIIDADMLKSLRRHHVEWQLLDRAEKAQGDGHLIWMGEPTGFTHYSWF